ncbi:TonB-dependent receptor [Shewanella corallii]|uniref:TonB-dependent receptor n=1 Tax=Shewanella corallii TaxID=560080 RepID=A0ABT0N420_9GAMM|nr:TonB-dependent receptor [Shewanella corallii]MCL2912532.1 TonB-dependent receptor [Shewanella corallii]
MSVYKKLPLSMVATALMGALSAPAIADDKEASVIDTITIFGSKNPLDATPGSAYELTQAELDNFKYTDIMRTLSTVPGVYIQEEDGYGLRPNIGMRGTGQNRSEKITVMEDGVIAAPAPYASPAAYYFPTPGRMESIEVLKGSSTIKYGPRTTGGVVNLLSRQIPEEEMAGKVDVALGQDGFGKLHAYGGGQGEQVGAVVEVFRYQADGFRDINHIGGDTGFDKTDALAKVRFSSAKDARFNQELEIKLKYSEETSNETYMGLTAADYASSPYSRYSASAKDQMNTEHKQIQLTHAIDLSSDVTLGTIAYYNDFHRNWYKTSKVNGLSLSKGGIDAAAAFDTTPGSDPLNVDIKANNRSYLSQGIQTELNVFLGDHELAFGARLHEDEMDRYQWVDKFQLDSSYQWSLNEAGVPGTDSNRIDSANALALYVQDKFTLGDVSILAGLRYEDIETRREDWGKNDPARVGTPGKDVKNSFDALLPALAATWQLNDDLLLLAGVQKGFAPAAPGNADKDIEESWNYEFGGRYNAGEFSLEAVAFYSDYSNMHGNCTAAQGCDDDNIGNQYNAGEVDVKGLELSSGYDFNAGGNITFPVKLSYTYTKAEFANDFSSDFDTWGDVEKGYELPYLPENQLYLAVGAKAETWELTLAGRYTSDIRTKAGEGSIPNDELIESKTVVDLSARYYIGENQEVYLLGENLFDETYMTTRVHGSIFSGKPRSFIVGYSLQF